MFNEVAPSHLNDFLNEIKTVELPLSISQERVDIDQVSDFTKKLIQMTGCNINTQKSLIASHKAQEEYLNSLNLLELYIKLGLKYTKIHRSFRFKQEAIFSDFIQTNIEVRNKAKTNFDKYLFKLV